ncbi:MAG: hypothetical protein HWE13_07130 [Gammaproteobacteria bacterium]|nr:hypothetical protein [Gammaproteobacteria bacterium]NVK87881.1 hypothetical protein [Gammaproteobacteria bacterium]
MTNINIFLILLGLLNGDGSVTSDDTQTDAEVQVQVSTDNGAGMGVTECKAFPECPPDMDT